MKIVFDQELIITSGREVIVHHPLAGEGACCLYLLFPHLDGLQVDRVEDAGNAVLITARSRAQRRHPGSAPPRAAGPAPRADPRFAVPSPGPTS